jgi:hypothetical protein
MAGRYSSVLASSFSTGMDVGFEFVPAPGSPPEAGTTAPLSMQNSVWSSKRIQIWLPIKGIFGSTTALANSSQVGRPVISILHTIPGLRFVQIPSLIHCFHPQARLAPLVIWRELLFCLRPDTDKIEAKIRLVRPYCSYIGETCHLRDSVSKSSTDGPGPYFHAGLL